MSKGDRAKDETAAKKEQERSFKIRKSASSRETVKKGFVEKSACSADKSPKKNKMTPLVPGVREKEKAGGCVITQQHKSSVGGEATQ